MKICLVLCAMLVCCSAQLYSVFSPPSPRYSFCFAEAFRQWTKKSIWSPSCRFVGWNIRQCDKRGRCWCVNSDSGNPMYWNPYSPTAEFNCNNFRIECPTSMVLGVCATCFQSCENIDTPQVCTLACRPGCTCPPNTYWHEGSCVTASECPQPSTTTGRTTMLSTGRAASPTTTTTTTSTTEFPVCPENQEYSSCAGCSLRCVDRFDPPPCSSDCTARCTCPPGMLLDGEICVLVEECPEIDPRCNATMVYSTCLGCVDTCSGRNDPVICPAVCMGEGCTCPPNTFLHEGKCLLEDQCPPDCPETQVFSYCASACDNTCAERNLAIPCPLVCLQKCTCPNGQYLNGERCVEASECPDDSGLEGEASTSSATTEPSTTPTQSFTTSTTNIESETTGQVCPENQIFSPCAGCSLRCVDRFDPPQCSSDCTARCTCPPGMLLDGEICVLVEECPEIDPRCNATMVYSTCLGCVDTCSGRNDPVICPAVCMGEGCTCPPNTFLHEGKCLLEDQCPPECPETQVYSYCASGCGNTCADRNLAPLCPFVCLQKCTCPNGQYLDGERCVEASECPDDTTCNEDLNEIFMTCAPPCDATCEEPNIECSLQESCNRRCACDREFLRDGAGVCVESSLCKASQSDTVSLTACQSRIANSEQESDLLCDDEGFFNTTQCTMLECFCVDKYSGETLTGTTRLRQFFDLDCSFLGDCPVNTNYEHCTTACPPTCENPLPRCTRQCAIDCSCTEGYVRMSRTNGTCIPKQDCPLDPNSCEYRQTMTTMGRYLNCDENGGYNAKQCDETATLCWCADENGDILPELIATANLTEEICQEVRVCRKKEGMEYSLCARSCDPTCEDRDGECREQPCTARCQCRDGLYYELSTKMCVEADFCPPPLPTCNEIRGEIFNPCAPSCDPMCDEPIRACSLSNECNFRCTCLPGLRRNPNGICVPASECPAPPPPTTSNSETTTTPRIRSVTDDPPSNCEATRDEIIANQLFDALIPTCTSDGYYTSRQCYGFILECWCADKVTGEELEGSRAVQFNPNYSIDCDNYSVPPPPPPPPSDLE